MSVRIAGITCVTIILTIGLIYLLEGSGKQLEASAVALLTLFSSAVSMLAWALGRSAFEVWRKRWAEKETETEAI